MPGLRYFGGKYDFFLIRGKKKNRRKGLVLTVLDWKNIIFKNVGFQLIIAFPVS